MSDMVKDIKKHETKNRKDKTMNNPIRFSQTMSGKHVIENGTGKVEIDLHDLTMEQARELINGLGNILTSLSACLWRAAEHHGDTRLCRIEEQKTQP